MDSMSHTSPIRSLVHGAPKPTVLQQVVVSKPDGPVACKLARVSSRCGVEMRLPEHVIEGERNHARISTNRGDLWPAAG